MARSAPSVSTRCWVSESTVHLSSPSVAKMPLFAFEQHRDIGAQRFSAASFADAGDTEHQTDAVPVAAVRPADAHANAVAGGPRAALALHLRVLPVEIEVERAAQARAQVAVAGGETAALHGGIGDRT